MIKQKVVLDQVEIRPDGTLQIQFDKVMYLPAKKRNRVTVPELRTNQEGHAYHRTVLFPGVDLDAQMAAVNRSLKELGWPPVNPADVERIRRYVVLEHTPEAIEAHRANLRAQGIRFGDEDDATDAEKGKS